jgi:hypothetical protein
VVRRFGRLLGVFVSGAPGVVALVALVAAREGTVVAKAQQGAYDRTCQASAIVTAPVTVPVSEVCSVPECWRQVIRDSDGNTFEACVSSEEYDRSRLGDFWHERTDR